MTSTLYWVRRDFRLGDNAALVAAVERGAPIVPVFIYDDVLDAQGAAPKARLEAGVRDFAKTLEAIGARLILRRGPALDVLGQLVKDTRADAVLWNRLYEPVSKEPHYH